MAQVVREMAENCRRDGLEVRLIASGNGSHRYVDCVPRVAGKEKALQVCALVCVCLGERARSRVCLCVRVPLYARVPVCVCLSLLGVRHWIVFEVLGAAAAQVLVPSRQQARAYAERGFDVAEGCCGSILRCTTSLLKLD